MFFHLGLFHGVIVQTGKAISPTSFLLFPVILNLFVVDNEMLHHLPVVDMLVLVELLIEGNSLTLSQILRGLPEVFQSLYKLFLKMLIGLESLKNSVLKLNLTVSIGSLELDFHDQY